MCSVIKSCAVICLNRVSSASSASMRRLFRNSSSLALSWIRPVRSKEGRVSLGVLVVYRTSLATVNHALRARVRVPPGWWRCIMCWCIICCERACQCHRCCEPALGNRCCEPAIRHYECKRTHAWRSIRYECKRRDAWGSVRYECERENLCRRGQARCQREH